MTSLKKIKRAMQKKDTFQEKNIFTTEANFIS